MSQVGQKERKIQQRVVKLFRDTLGYRYLGNWEEILRRTGTLHGRITPHCERPTHGLRCLQ